MTYSFHKLPYLLIHYCYCLLFFLVPLVWHFLGRCYPQCYNFSSFRPLQLLTPLSKVPKFFLKVWIPTSKLLLLKALMIHNPFLNGILFIWSFIGNHLLTKFVVFYCKIQPIANEGGSLLSDEQLIRLLSPTFSGVMVLLCIATHWTWANGPCTPILPDGSLREGVNHTSHNATLDMGK